MRSVVRLAIVSFLGLALGAIVIAHNALHVPWHVIPQPDAANALARHTPSRWSEVTVKARDGAILSAWLFTPPHPNGAGVIALHGVADTRLGMLAHAEYLLRNGFTVLVPDCRGHGRSGGAILSYGVLEATDVHLWAARLLQDPSLRRLYGIGQSMGAAILLESLRTEPRFRAVVADSSFATFEEIAYERLEQIGHLPKPVFWPVVRLGFLYGDVRYGVDLRQASPVEAVRHTHVPILLIHGGADTNIPPHHSQELQAANPVAARLWIVPGAEHTQSISADPQRYARTVVDWFHSHP